MWLGWTGVVWVRRSRPGWCTNNVELVTRLGADRVIDYIRTVLCHLTDRFDFVFDTVGTLSAASGRRLLTVGGILLLAVADLWHTLRARSDV